MSAAPIPNRLTLPRLREAAAGCRACPLWAPATQTVFGEGAPQASIMLVGEQPGDREDREGAPFVGPAGRLLDDALREAGIDRGDVYVTNVVKHFRFEERGTRRIHQRPQRTHVTACRPWLDAELAVVRPEVLVCLGATAALALLGRDVRVTRDRGRRLETELATLAMVTVHPSSILRSRSSEDRAAALRAFTEDLRAVAGAAAAGRS